MSPDLLSTRFCKKKKKKNTEFCKKKKKNDWKNAHELIGLKILLVIVKTKLWKYFIVSNSDIIEKKYSRLSLSRSRRDPLNHFEIFILRHIRFSELRKIPIEQPNFTNEHVI